MFWGTIGGLAQGAIIPCFSLIFGELIDAFSDLGPGFLDRVLDVALFFLYAGIAALFATYGNRFSCVSLLLTIVLIAQIGFWTWTATRQNHVIRNEYLKAILRQEVAWFDQTPSGELTTRIVS